MSSTDPQQSTLAGLSFFQIQVSSDVLGSDVAKLLESNHSLPGVIVMQDGRLCGMVSRNQFFQRLGRLFGIEIYSTRPITAYLDSLRQEPCQLPHTTTIQEAAVVCLARPIENVYDPFIVTVPDEAPRLVDFLALILRQTELMASAQAETQAQRELAVSANNAKSEFLANMSHELRTPLTAVIGYSEILVEDAQAAGQAQMIPRLNNIIRAGAHLLEMINGILDLSKVEAGRMELSLETEPLASLVYEVADTLQPVMAKNGNVFNVLCAEALGEIHTDTTKLRQCLFNLLSNAAKFTHHGRVLLCVDQETLDDVPCAVFRVQDSGIGMSQPQMVRLFEAFYQADSSISRRYGGTGLGLNLTKRFSEMMGGSLSVESEENKGTAFTLKIPFRPPASHAVRG